MGTKNESLTHHCNVVVIPRRIINRDLQLGENLGGESKSRRIGIVHDITGVHNKVGRERERVDRGNQGDGAITGIGPADRVMTIRAEVCVADVDDFQHGRTGSVFRWETLG